MLVLDSGAITRLAEPSHWADARIRALRESGLWPPIVPTVVAVESSTGRSDRDAKLNRFIKSCEVNGWLPLALARRAAALRYQARRGSAVDAIVVAIAEPDGVVLTGDPTDLQALAANTSSVTIRPL